MFRSSLCCVIVVCGALFVSDCFGAITYIVQEREATESGWHFGGGVIKTDGTIGEISAVNFVAWNFAFASPRGSYRISSDDGFAALSISSGVPVNGLRSAGGALALVASESQLRISDFGDGSTRSFLELTFSTEAIGSEHYPGRAVHFAGSNSISSSSIVGGMVDPDAGGVLGRRSSAFLFSDDESTLGVVSSIPEPSRFNALLIILASACRCRRLRTRR